MSMELVLRDDIEMALVRTTLKNVGFELPDTTSSTYSKHETDTTRKREKCNIRQGGGVTGLTNRTRTYDPYKTTGACDELSTNARESLPSVTQTRTPNHTIPPFPSLPFPSRLQT